eukprot:TRINITY_DN13361_c0_g1_i2.p1 TRINITY_DN13361_c0_g1~~TRINITY_DN13361_c0_g1_i2.p1  ORF type:complete len:1202 (+),score=292.24 TRINITY_DN13361_c0_g1_i2:38-3643(+)
MASADVLSHPADDISAADAVSHVEEINDERVLGASTADQVLGRWQEFIGESSRLLRAQLSLPAEWRRLPPRGSAKEPWLSAEADEAGTSATSSLCLGATVVGRAVAALASTVEEARRCKSAAPELCRALAIFGEALGPESDGEERLQTPPQLLVEMAELLPTLRSLRQLFARIEVVAEHLVRQLAGVHSASLDATHENEALRGLTRQPLRPALDLLGELLAVPVAVDGLVLESGRLRTAFASYSWIVGRASGASSLGEVAGAAAQLPELSSEVSAALVSELRQAESIMRGDSFQLCLAHVVDALEDLCQGAVGAAFKEQLSGYFRARLEESEAIGTAATTQLWLPAESLVSWVCSFVLFAKAFPQNAGRVDRSFLGEVWRMHKKSPVVVLHGRVVWCIGEFLQSYLPELVAEANLRRELEELSKLRARQAAKLDDGSFAQEMQNSSAAVALWLASLRTTSQLAAGPVGQGLKEVHSLLLRGLTLALRVRVSLEEYLVLHVREGVPVPRACLASVALGFQVLKSIEDGPSKACWAEMTVLLQRHLALRLQQELQESGSKVRSEAPREALRLAAAALHRLLGGIAEDQLEPYFDIGALALSLCCASRSEPVTAGITGCWRQLRVASTWRSHLARLCDTSWCYWMRELLPELLADVRQRPNSVSALPPLFAAFASPLNEIVDEGTAAGKAFLSELQSALETGVLQPLCTGIEEDLRLLTHATMQANRDILPSSPPAEYLALLKLRPLSLTKKSVVDIKDQVELRLSRRFYDLAALSQQDAEAYARMRHVALQRYNLQILDGGLPAGSLDQGLDVVDVMRNVHLLATQYGYSLHQQFFTQASNQGDAKIRTITVEHLAASIRVHGTGVVNTAVNYTVGFVKRKLEVIAEFLADESVKSRLLADQTWLEGQTCYTWARALDTARFMRRLGAGKDGVSYLDKLRQVLTQIGNSLGYVRMVRTAGMRSMAGSLDYLEACPWLGEGKRSSGSGKSELLEAAESADCEPDITEAAILAESAARSVRRCFEASTDHLNLIAGVFTAVLQRPSGSFGVPAMRLFHLLVPAAACSFLDALLVGRDTLAKRAVAPSSGPRGNVVLFDDGFAVGVAFVLRVFGLDHSFQALHWFDTEIADGDVATGQARRAAGLEGSVGHPPAQSEADRRAQLEAELGRLAAAVEAAAALFGKAAPTSVSAAAAAPESAVRDPKS